MKWYTWRLGRLAGYRSATWCTEINDRHGRWLPLPFGLWWCVK